jgi:hypothetical protein
LKFLGAVVALYVLYAAFRGEVYAKSGVWGKVISREQSPSYFWMVIASYACLAVVLIMLF